MYWAVIFDFKNRWIRYEMVNAHWKIHPIWTDLGQRPRNMGTLIGRLDDYCPHMIREKAESITKIEEISLCSIRQKLLNLVIRITL